MRLPLTGVRLGNGDICLIDEDEGGRSRDVTVGASETWKLEDDDRLNDQAGTDK
jgi:hypothetical protein